MKAMECVDLTVHYDHNCVLWDISVEIPAGKIVGIIGPNGAGKSTLLKAALGIVQPLSGHVAFFDEPVAYIPQRESVDWDFPITAYELVLMGRYGLRKWYQRCTAADRGAAERALDCVGMSAFKDRQIGQLSGGQQQRLFFARALARDPRILLLDEPFSAIDIATEKVLMQRIASLRDEGKTILVVNHDLHTAFDFFDWIILLNTSLIAAGPTKEVLTRENLARAYGNNHSLFDEAQELSHKQFTGRL